MHNTEYFLQIKHLFLTIFLLFGLLVPGSTVSAKVSDDSEEGMGFSAILYDNSNGLPTSEANAIAQTGNGFILETETIKFTTKKPV